MDAYKNITDKKRYFWLLLGGVIALATGLGVTVQYIPSFEHREGFVPFDPFMDYLPVMDVSLLIFFLLYSTILFSFFYFIRRPVLFLHLLYSFGIMYWFRTICITCVPLNEPAQLVPLNDPFIEQLNVYQAFIKRDLFFSGHFASVFIPYLLLAKGSAIKRVALLFSILIGIGVMVQHIHYSYDVLGAILFSSLAVLTARKFVSALMPTI